MHFASLSFFMNGPDTSFRIFAAGWNETNKGKFLFDAQAAAEVMAKNKAHGVDTMIDLEHLSLDDSKRNYNPDAKGWARLELRDDGSLWAIDVKWTPDGLERLTSKSQRYISPTFLYDQTTKRISEVWNIALTAQPATHNTKPLIAASKGNMTLDQLPAIAEAMGLAPDAPLEDLLATFVAFANTIQGGAPAADDGPPDSSADGAVAMAEKAPAPDASGDAPAPDAKKKNEDPKAAMAASARLMRLSGKATLSEVVSDVETWRASHLELETERQKLASERATLESAERRKLCASLVTLGAEFPSTVWADDKSKALKSRWTKIAIEELRAHVAEQTAARGPKAASNGNGVRPPAQADGSGLSSRELAICKETGCDPKVYASLKGEMGMK